MLRETTFFWGGVVAIALGALIAAALTLGGAGAPFAGAWVGAAVSVGLGVFFLRVGRVARRYRREYLRAVEEGRAPPAGGPPV